MWASLPSNLLLFSRSHSGYLPEMPVRCGFSCTGSFIAPEQHRDTSIGMSQGACREFRSFPSSLANRIQNALAYSGITTLPLTSLVYLSGESRKCDKTSSNDRESVHDERLNYTIFYTSKRFIQGLIRRRGIYRID